MGRLFEESYIRAILGECEPVSECCEAPVVSSKLWEIGGECSACGGPCCECCGEIVEDEDA